MKLSFVIDRFEGEQAVLKAKTGDMVVWPKKSLPAELKEGSMVEFTITDNKGKEADNRALAKNILNEILNPNNQSK